MCIRDRAESGLEADLGIRALENALRQQQYKGLFDLLAAERAGQGGGTQTESNNVFSSGDTSKYAQAVLDFLG